MLCAFRLLMFWCGRRRRRENRTQQQQPVVLRGNGNVWYGSIVEYDTRKEVWYHTILYRGNRPKNNRHLTLLTLSLTRLRDVIVVVQDWEQLR